MKTIVSEELSNRWYAYFSGVPGIAFSGDRPAGAAARLCQVHQIEFAAFTSRAVAPDRVEFFIGRRECRDCNGSGSYFGSDAVEDCRTCYGAGRVE
jgi:hypothetical protein